MRKKMLILNILILLVIVFFYLQFSRKPTVCSVVTSNDSKGYTTTITITMNQLVILNKKKTERNLINQIMSNSFQNIQFSYDVMGYPQKVIVHVYSNRFLKNRGAPAFRFSFSPDITFPQTEKQPYL